MDIPTRWMTPSPWKLLLLLPILEIVSACPIHCTCTRLPSKSLLSNVLLSSSSTWNKTEPELVSCTHQSLQHLPSDFPPETMYLDVSHNMLATTEDVNPNLTNLRTAIFTNNKITTLQIEEFYELPSLQELIFKQNSISSVEPYTFHNSSNLKLLDLSQNRLVSLGSGMFEGLSSLGYLNLSRNHIQDITPGAFTPLDRLQNLDLSFNSLKHLHLHMFDGLVDLRVLNLSYNLINYISADTFSTLVNLEELILSQNMLSLTSPFLFRGLMSLRYLDLSNNLLTVMSEHTFDNASNLQSLFLEGNSISQINIPVFKQLKKLEYLSLSMLPYLRGLAYNTFAGLANLKSLNLSCNPQLSSINPHLFSPLTSLQTLDIHNNNISHLSQLTFHTNLNLTRVHLSQNPLQCDCDIAWLAKKLQQNNSIFGTTDLKCAISNADSIPIHQVTNDTFPCAKVPVSNTSSPDKLFFKVGASAHLDCNISVDSSMVVIWRTPRRKTLTYHAINPEAIDHHPSVGYRFEEREWINSTSYHSEMVQREDRVVILSDGSLFIDYVLRSDTGPYTCEVRNAYHNVSRVTYVWLDYQVLFDVKMWSLMIGFSCAASFFVLIVVYTLIRQCSIRVINKRRREAIRQVLENLDMYKRNQITRIRDNYNTQLARVSDHYHNQLERLRTNYSMQMGRVRRGCSHQVDRIRDNYNTQVGRLKDYSSHQIEQLRTAYSNQLLKIRDYGSLTFDRLRETCKLQQQNVIKILDTMNIENCKNVIETECMRTESMIFEPKLLIDDDIQALSLTGSESEYITATDSDDSKSSSSDSQETDIGIESVHNMSVEADVEGMFKPLPDTQEDVSEERATPPIILELDLGDISLQKII